MTAGETGDDALARLGARLDSLAPAESRVATVILEDPGGAAGLTITELAARAGTSEATVIRLARRLGLTGYQALRIALATAAGRAASGAAPLVSPEVAPDDTLADVVAKVGSIDARAAADTADNLDLGVLAAAVAAIDSARRIDVYGVGASGIVALDLQQKLHRIGLAVTVWQDAHSALPSAANLTAADVAIAISHSGTTIDTRDALARAGASGALTVAVTADGGSPVAAAAEHVLLTSARESALRSGAMASRIAELTVVDCIFVAVAQRRYAESVAALTRTRESVRSRHRGRRP